MGAGRTVILDARILAAANINPSTGLATDYLNHYNEVAMLIGSLADMPDMVGAILDWRPVDYPDHFHITGFRDKELAVSAWESAPAAVKERFEAMKREIDIVIAIVQVKLAADPAAAAALVPRASGIYDRIARLGGVINGAEPPTPSAIKAAAAAAAPEPAAIGAGTISQADIDSLFA